VVVASRLVCMVVVGRNGCDYVPEVKRPKQNIVSHLLNWFSTDLFTFALVSQSWSAARVCLMNCME